MSTTVSAPSGVDVDRMQCHECKRTLRRPGETAAEFPGGVKNGAGGKCSTCHQRDLREGRGPLIHGPRRGKRTTARRDEVPMPAFDGTEPCSRDPELWFPDGDGSSPASRDASEGAKAACLACQLVDPCLAYALARKPQGIWGGTTEAERRSINRRGRTHPDPIGDQP